MILDAIVVRCFSVVKNHLLFLKAVPVLFFFLIDKVSVESKLLHSLWNMYAYTFVTWLKMPGVQYTLWNIISFVGMLLSKAYHHQSFNRIYLAFLNER